MERQSSCSGGWKVSLTEVTGDGRWHSALCRGLCARPVHDVSQKRSHMGPWGNKGANLSPTCRVMFSSIRDPDLQHPWQVPMLAFLFWESRHITWDLHCLPLGQWTLGSGVKFLFSFNLRTYKSGLDGKRVGNLTQWIFLKVWMLPTFDSAGNITSFLIMSHLLVQLTQRNTQTCAN